MGTGKKKIEIKRKEKESDRLVTFSKRRKGLFKKAHQLHSLSGANIALLVFSPANKPYVYGHPSFDATVDHYYYSTLINNSNNKTTSTSTSTAAQKSDNNNNNVISVVDDDEDSAETELWRSWLETMEVEEYDQVDDLLVIKNDLEQIRDKLIKRIAAGDNE